MPHKSATQYTHIGFFPNFPESSVFIVIFRYWTGTGPTNKSAQILYCECGNRRSSPTAQSSLHSRYFRWTVGLPRNIFQMYYTHTHIHTQSGQRLHALNDVYIKLLSFLLYTGNITLSIDISQIDPNHTECFNTNLVSFLYTVWYIGLINIVHSFIWHQRE